MSSFKPIKLNDGRSIPSIGYGTWRIGNGEIVVQQVDQALSTGFDHIDTAQIYRNEDETGDALALSGIPRNELWITSKYSGADPALDIYESCKASLSKLKLKSLDLYLIHHPRLCNGDIPGAWKQMERIRKEGLSKSIGVSNFSIDDLKILLKSADTKPAVNQIMIQPYVWEKTKKLMDFQAEHGIVAEGYSSLIPLTQMPNGPVTKPLKKIAKRLDLEPEQVLLAWVKAKGAVILTTSSKKERLERYLAVGDIDLTDSDVEAIDKAGARPYVPSVLSLSSMTSPPSSSSDEASAPSSSPSWMRRMNYAALLMFVGYVTYHWCCISLLLTEQREYVGY